MKFLFCEISSELFLVFAAKKMNVMTVGILLQESFFQDIDVLQSHGIVSMHLCKGFHTVLE